MDGILENATQETVYSVVAHDLVENTLGGYNSTILSYGQTGAGKTYTMGQAGNYQQRGIVPRALAQIFQDVDTRVDRQCTVRVSYLEIYNDQLYDLLSDSPATADALHCMEDGGNVVIKGLTQKLVRAQALRPHLSPASSSTLTSHLHPLGPFGGGRPRVLL